MNATIFSYLETSFEKKLYQAALRNLEDTGNPLRLSNFAYAMRELVRHFLDRLAPSKSVLACSWYKNETDKPDGITRRQRAYYAVQGGLSNSFVQNILGLETDEIHKTLIKAIDRLSKFTHIQPELFEIPQEEIHLLTEETESAVADLIEKIDECRRNIVNALWGHIDQAVVSEIIQETILAIDEISTHHSIDDVYIETIDVISISHDRIEFAAAGSIGAELQWGSNSDIRNDMGAVMSDDFPFECRLSSPVSDPDEISVEPESLIVDASDWHNEDEDEY